MQQFIGEWYGTGTATLPAMPATPYREVLIFEPHADDAILKVEQKTWRIHTDQSESLLYWECGFLRQMTDDTCEWINAQNNGRTEILGGEIVYAAHETLLELKSSEFSNDSRMIASLRQLQVKKNQLTYTSHIATQDHPTLYLHLVAKLERQNNL